MLLKNALKLVNKKDFMNKNIVAIVIVCLCLLCLFVGIVGSNKSLSYYNDSAQDRKFHPVFSTSSKIAVVTLDGVIDSTNKVSAFSNDFNAQAALKSLKMAGKDAEIKGVILKINTPGGTVAMSQSIYNEVLRIRKNKPVVVVMEDLAASGGYYIASAADRIYALPGTLTGSVGVIFSTMDVHQLLSQKLLISPNVIKSGKYKDIGSGYRTMTKDDRKLLKGIVDDSYSQFLDAITVGRIKRNDLYTVPKSNLTLKVLKSHADGRVFTGRQAQKLGFVDSIGDLTDAQAAIKTMVNEKFGTKSDVILVPYSKSSTFGEYLSGMSESIFTGKASLESFLPVSMQLSRRPLYLWE